MFDAHPPDFLLSKGCSDFSPTFQAMRAARLARLSGGGGEGGGYAGADAKIEHP